MKFWSASVVLCVERLPFQDLHGHQVEMDRMGIAGEIENAPDFGVSGPWCLRCGVPEIPGEGPGRQSDAGTKSLDQPAIAVEILIQRQISHCRRRAFVERDDHRQRQRRSGRIRRTDQWPDAELHE